MATGVLILGVGRGTKVLGKFLECTKSYEAVVLFGAATDSYDAVGKVVKKAPYEHVTKEAVEKALEKFRGKIMQQPPVFSALKVKGKPLYQYAREGKEIPVEIEERPVEVESLEMVNWMEGGTHSYHWPEEVASEEEKLVLKNVVPHVEDSYGPKRKREESEADAEVEGRASKRKESSPAPEPTSTDLPNKRKRDDLETDNESESRERNQSPSKRTKLPPEPLNRQVDVSALLTANNAADKSPCQAPACCLRMTVTSGFYVRSLAHDLGAAVGSLALMSSLIRTRQGDYELGENVFEYDDLAKGEEAWAPKVGGMLQKWRGDEGMDSEAEEIEALKRRVPEPKDAKPKLRAKLRAGKEKLAKKRDREQREGSGEEGESES